MKYENKKNGKIATLESTNEKFKTVVLVFEDGTTTTISISTLKRWWKEIPEEETIEQDAPESLKEVVDAQADFNVINDFENNDVYIEVREDVAGDGTPLAEVGKEIAEQAKEKAKKAKEKSKKASNKVKTKAIAKTKKKAEASKKKSEKQISKQSKKQKVADNKEQLQEVIEALKETVFSFANDFGDEILIPESKSTCKALKIDGRRYIEFFFSSRSLRICVTQNVVDEIGIEPTATVVRNSNFKNDYVFNTTELEKSKQLVLRLLEVSRSYLINNLENKENTKTKKGEN